MKSLKKRVMLAIVFFKIESSIIPLDTLNIPYFFLLDKNLKTDCTFIPHKEILSQTQKYLEIIKKKISI